LVELIANQRRRLAFAGVASVVADRLNAELPAVAGVLA
jgi:hypothetical protein